MKIGVLVEVLLLVEQRRGALLTGKGLQIGDILQHIPIVVVYHDIVHLWLREDLRVVRRALFEYLGGFPAHAESIA